MEMEQLKSNVPRAYSKILLPLDGSEYSLKAVLPAKTLALYLNAPIHILNVADGQILEKDLLNKAGITPKEFPEFVITRRQGEPAQEIVKESQSASFIVMCSYGENYSGTDLIGPVTEEVLANSEVPVLLVRPDSVISEEKGLWQIKRFLMPMDGTPESAQAYTSSLKIAEKTNAKIDVLHIFSKSASQTPEGALNAPFYEDYPDQEWPFWSHEFIKSFCSCPLKHIPVDLSLFKGDPADAILNFYEENHSDLIVMAWKGELSESHAQVLKKVLKNITCPLMLVKIHHKNLLQKPKPIE